MYSVLMEPAVRLVGVRASSDTPFSRTIFRAVPVQFRSSFFFSTTTNSQLSNVYTTTQFILYKNLVGLEGLGRLISGSFVIDVVGVGKVIGDGGDVLEMIQVDGRQQMKVMIRRLREMALVAAVDAAVVAVTEDRRVITVEMVVVGSVMGVTADLLHQHHHGNL